MPRVKNSKEINKIKEAIKDKNEDSLNALYYGLEETDDGYFEILLTLFNEEWHNLHRNIVYELQRLKNPKAIDALYKVIVNGRKFLPKREYFWVYSRAVWALADIGTVASKEKLVNLKNFTNKDVVLLAQKRLSEWDNELTRKAFKVFEHGFYLTDEEDDSYTKELFTELVEGHPLFGKLERVVVHQDRVWDDVLCKYIGEDKYIMVHLTWRGDAEFAGYPSFENATYSWDEFVDS